MTPVVFYKIALASQMLGILWLKVQFTNLVLIYSLKWKRQLFLPIQHGHGCMQESMVYVNM